MIAVLGPRPPAQASGIEDFDKRIIDRGGPVVVLNGSRRSRPSTVRRGNSGNRSQAVFTASTTLWSGRNRGDFLPHRLSH